VITDILNKWEREARPNDESVLDRVNRRLGRFYMEGADGKASLRDRLNDRKGIVAEELDDRTAEEIFIDEEFEELMKEHKIEMENKRKKAAELAGESLPTILNLNPTEEELDNTSIAILDKERSEEDEEYEDHGTGLIDIRDVLEADPEVGSLAREAIQSSSAKELEEALSRIEAIDYLDENEKFELLKFIGEIRFKGTMK